MIYLKALATMQAISAERGPSNILISQAPYYASPDQVLLEQSRKKTDQLIQELYDQINLSSHPTKPQLLGYLGKTHRQLRVARKGIDFFHEPQNGRPEHIDGLIEEMFNAMPPIQSAVYLLAENLIQSAPEAALLTIQMALTAELRDNAGKLGSLLMPALITGKDLDTSNLARINETQGRILQIREQTRRLTQLLSQYGQITQSSEQMEQIYFQTGLRQYHVLIQQMQSHQQHVNAKSFTTDYVQAMQAIVGFSDEFQKLANTLAKNKETETLLSLCWTVLLIISLFSISLFLLSFLQRRIVNPIEQARTLLGEAVSGHAQSRSIAYPYQDEIGELFSAIQIVNRQHQERNQLLTERSQLVSQLQKEKEVYQSILDNTRDVIWLFDMTRKKFLFVSPSIQTINGWQVEEAMQEDFYQRVEFAEFFAALNTVLDEHMSAGARPETTIRVPVLEVEMPHKNGEMIPIEISGSILIGKDGSTHFLGISRDISSRKKSEHLIKKMAFFDKLTDLPNRSYFDEKIESMLLRAEQEHTLLGLVFIDLDDFKPVNDRYGHEVGDELLKAVAGRLQACVRQNDVAARLGGDEFVVIMPDLQDEQAAQILSERLRESIYQPFTLNSVGQLKISCSVGIALYPDHGKTVAEIMRHSDIAMYAAKRAGRNRIQFFSAEINAAVNRN
ncbi:sensor domain-containing diguanylate cyclase [Undibacterium rugosum]|uniref:GGDEF domain-containing protein n=1 Tax=Undibacterium rugosum TaxID=2762291 RepID=A0A923I022_9BURK|nr:sensor domain-containing diguanylate cyclase [Undibacterium rugosum]MBC3933987.1 GGDEF domain-containing protein [Undibacterium rugosum]MBR7777698.1 GGDEF domain-containing protein [Undibacterium rugosum]